jgi:catechol 2,3-dioxygenase-like lactoylglutathione lyase family enzyme
MSEQTRTRITEVRTVGVPVADQDRAVEFYLGTLGFELRLDVVFGEGQRWVEVAPPGGGTSVALVQAREGVATGVDTGIRFTTLDAEADHADLRSRQVDVDQEILRMGFVPPMFSFRDPDRNRLVIVEGAESGGE